MTAKKTKKKTKTKTKRLVGRDVQYVGMQRIFGKKLDAVIAPSFVAKVKAEAAKDRRCPWEKQGRYQDEEQARRHTEAQIGQSLKRGLLEVKYAFEPSKSRPGTYAVQVYARRPCK